MNFVFFFYTSKFLSSFLCLHSCFKIVIKIIHYIYVLLLDLFIVALRFLFVQLFLLDVCFVLTPKFRLFCFFVCIYSYLLNFFVLASKLVFTFIPVATDYMSTFCATS